ncbi:protein MICRORCHIDIA 6 isoform X4 [Lolium perenne]|uniref:protein MICRORCHIDIA 6 isoform X4 n=1 Tax=Lolium perenne TaxID=4522 RepID=UPI0021F58345|nr:protein MICRORCHIDIA 6-like isoform X4 [Lolium perenne]
MALVDWIDLSSDDDDDEPMVEEEEDAQAPGQAPQIKEETVDLTMEQEDDVNEGDNNAHFVLPTQEFLQGVQQAMQPANQLLVTPAAQEAMQPGNHQVPNAAVDRMEETMQSETAAGDAPSSFIAADNRAEEATQSKHACEAAASSTMTEQDASSCLSMSEQAATPSSSSTQHQNHQADALLCSPPVSTAAHFPRQFWKAGEYKVAAQASINNGQNCLRINPKFLHSNATSHKWAFGAIAELLDNVVDEVQNGATYVKIDKLKYSPGEYSLVIQDDGGGMSPEYLRHCLSFGFSNKCTNSSIGQYGNGFKTSTMRLGADAIIFSCRQDKTLTQSVGLLSYTFLTRTGCNDILVPVFRDMGCHGTKVFVFNLWFNDAWEMELDFTTDDEDIMISGAQDERMKVGRLNHMHIANRFRYSLRVYASILYLRLPEHFKVILCGRVVEPHHIVNDLIYRECVEYRPRVGVSAQADVITTIGFLKGAPKLNIYGFNIYHRNRLILPFWSTCSERGKGKGIVGVLEANFIRPTHDKQDFEKTELFQRLETRLKDMTTEYWRFHAHLIGQQQVTKARPPAHYASFAVINDDSSATRATTKTYAGNSRKTSVVLDPCFSGEPCKRRNSDSVNETRAQKRQNTNDDANYPGSVGAVEVGKERSRVLIYQNKTLKDECSVLEAAGQQLLSKANELSNELREFQRLLRSLTDELQFHDGLSALQHTTPIASSSYMGVGWI